MFCSDSCWTQPFPRRLPNRLSLQSDEPDHSTLAAQQAGKYRWKKSAPLEHPKFWYLWNILWHTSAASWCGIPSLNRILYRIHISYPRNPDINRNRSPEVSTGCRKGVDKTKARRFRGVCVLVICYSSPFRSHTPHKYNFTIVHHFI